MLTDDEKRRTRRHLGYTNVAQASTFFLGIPAAMEPMFMLESAMNLLLPAGETEVREALCLLDAEEARIWGNSDALTTTKVDEIQFRDDEFEKRIQRYRFWQGRLANALGLPGANPFDARFIGLADGGINRPVSHG